MGIDLWPRPTAVHCPTPGAEFEIICLWGLVKSIQSQCRINGFYTFPGSTEEGWVISDNTKIESKWTPESMLTPVLKLKSDKKMRKAIIVKRGRIGAIECSGRIYGEIADNLVTADSVSEQFMHSDLCSRPGVQLPGWGGVLLLGRD